jgi:hypothetical protein
MNMSHVLTIHLPDEIYEPLRRSAEQEQRSPEEVAAEWLAAAVRTIDEDPVIKLLGTVECDLTDVADRHDYYIGESLMRELRGGDEP